MKQTTRREALKMCATLPFAARFASASSLLPSSQASDASAANPTQDWSEALITSTMHRTPDPANLGTWGYAIALYLYGQYLFYKRTGDKKHLDYIQGWIDSHVNDAGEIDRKITALDYMLPGNLLIVLHQETGKQKYKTAADTIRHTFDNYPRTTDGGFWHAYSRQHQLWLDGMYMSMPFLVRYGQAFNDKKYACDEAVKQLLIYAKHLNDPASGLLYHAYDESGQQPWAQPATHHSSFFWCRAIGWYGMALIEVLEVLPHHHAQRGDLIKLVQQLAAAYEKYQDPATGRWYEVVDKATTPGNWLETSSSSMYTYTLSRAIERGYIHKRYASVMNKGYKGVLTQLSRDSDGSTHLHNICGGTNVGDLQFYLDRPRNTDDFHGLGAFLIMNEQLRKHQA
ncbi:glycosyl hydrolase [Edaphobacter acidisoli]|uniref:Glycosyl hydrolase n=1 Tax=Edaphobacter acidisoli TaxID=2040573 RepID=A0A916RR67_9BACT|nr:glycoside hydrolase family 88 protein [Edaphobacter acidisoli]GGA66256.1 glycosyl hydrolase [Edaphobacter acidisoli]